MTSHPPVILYASFLLELSLPSFNRCSTTLSFFIKKTYTTQKWVVHHKHIICAQLKNQPWVFPYGRLYKSCQSRLMDFSVPTWSVSVQNSKSMIYFIVIHKGSGNTSNFFPPIVGVIGSYVPYVLAIKTRLTIKHSRSKNRETNNSCIS